MGSNSSNFPKSRGWAWELHLQPVSTLSTLLADDDQTSDNVSQAPVVCFSVDLRQRLSSIMSIARRNKHTSQVRTGVTTKVCTTLLFGAGLIHCVTRLQQWLR